jgi:NAD(P)-dependent dehydrogenase (short-subunit alcohol dehydrogenase family)
MGISRACVARNGFGIDISNEMAARAQQAAATGAPCPMTGIGQPEEIASTALYLASEDSSFIT